MRIVLRILGTEIFEIETGATTEVNHGTSYSASNAETQPTSFGFIPAGIEFTKPQPE